MVPRYRALILRRTFPQLREVIDRTRSLYPLIIPGAKYNESAREWRFPSGAKVIFGYLEADGDCDQYQGQEYQFIGWEELTQWPTPYCYDYMRSRLRGTDLKLVIRATCNPGGVGSKWVQDYWRIPDSGQATRSERQYTVQGNVITIRRRFIPARVTDNPHLDASYQANLLAQPELVRRALLEGRWDVMDIPGQIYKAELDAARISKRITRVPWDPAVPVQTGWDLGIGDATAIWCAQVVGREIHLIDYYEASGEALTHYFAWLAERKNRGWRFDQHIWPHDGKARELISGKSREEVAQANGLNVTILPPLNVDDGINAVRLAFPRMLIDDGETTCKRGLECLTHYRREYNKALGEFKARPVHDWSSHGADALRTLVLGLNETVLASLAPLKIPRRPMV